MFIKLTVSRKVGFSDKPNDWSETDSVWFDVHNIQNVRDDDGHASFVAVYGADAEIYRTADANADDLVEAIIQLRMHPAEGLPSRNVGKAGDDDRMGHFRWSAKGAK